MPYVPPARLSYWESRLYHRTTAGEAPYVPGDPDPVTGQGGYGLDYGEHYDPELGYLNIQAYSDANGLGLDTSDQVAAAIHNYRDLAVRATSNVYLSGPNAGDPNEETPGVPQWHVFLAGIAKHYLAGGSADAADEEAADILMSLSYYPDDDSFRQDKFHIGQQRELALAFWAMLERHAMGLGTHDRVDTACELALGHLGMWSAPPEARRFGIWCKFFMSALTCRALTRYMELFGDSADAAKVANCAAIPAALAAFADWVWTDGWIAIGVDPEGWNKGSIRYMQPGHADPSLAPIEGLAITSVGANPRRNFTGPASLSSLDDHYTGSIFQVDGIADQFTIVAYDGATRGITLGSYAPGRDITTSDTFSILTNPVNRDLTEGNGASPDLNPMVFPLYAWLYRHYTVTDPDPDLAATARERAHAVFDGAYQSWNDAFAQKQYNQAALWTTDGLGWLEEADTFDGEVTPPAGILLLYSPAGGILIYRVGATGEPSGDVIDVTAAPYNAAGDGTTDDAAAVNAALGDAAPGDVVFVPAGDYRIGSPIVLGTSGVTLRGEGPSSVLRLADDSRHSAIVLPQDPAVDVSPSTNISGVVVEDLTIDGNLNPGVAVGDPELAVPDYFGIYGRHADGLTIRRVTVRDFPSDGITISNGYRPLDGLLIERCRVERCGRSGIHIGFSTNGIIRYNIIADVPSQYWKPASAHAIDVEVEGFDSLGPAPYYPYVRDLLIEDNILMRAGSQTSGDGVAVQPAYGPIDGVTIRRNVISGHQGAVEATGSLAGYGVDATVRNLAIADNWLTTDIDRDVTGYPLQMAGVSGLTVSGNVMNDRTDGGFSGGGVNSAINIDRCLTAAISGNLIYLTRIWPNAVSKVYGGSTGVSVVGNQYHTYADQLVIGDDAGSVAASGNTALPASPWDRTLPPAPAFDLEDGDAIVAATDVTVTATDADSAIDRVFFLVDGLIRGISDAAPHVFTLDPDDYAAGEHTLSARAIDSMANFGDEASIAVTIGAVSAPAYAILQEGTDDEVLQEGGDELLQETN